MQERCDAARKSGERWPAKLAWQRRAMHRFSSRRSRIQSLGECRKDGSVNSGGPSGRRLEFRRCSLTPELSRAAKRRRLGRIVRCHPSCAAHVG